MLEVLIAGVAGVLILCLVMYLLYQAEKVRQEDLLRRMRLDKRRRQERFLATYLHYPASMQAPEPEEQE